MSETPALQLDGVSLTYDGPPRVHALRDVSVQIWPGELVAVVGPSGAGKSSLLHVLGLLKSPSNGHLILRGDNVDDLDDKSLTAARGRGVGFVFQAFYLLEERTVLENVALPMRYQRALPRISRARALEALRSVGLDHRAYARARDLSGGERQRVAIARALVTGPAVLLCDEPTGNLDSENGARVLRLLRDLNTQGHTIVIITHDEQIAAALPRTIRVLDGRVVSDRGSSGPVTGHVTPVAASSHPRHRHDGRLRAIDLIDEAVGSLVERGWRTALTCLGTVLGVATLVAILGVAATTSAQVSTQFDRLAATTVTARSENARAFESPQLDRVGELHGVEGVALLQPLDDATVDAGPTAPEAVAASSLPVVTATPDSWRVIEPTLAWGRTFDEALAARRVAVLGAAAARQAGIYGPLGTQSILIGGEPYVVIGVFDDVARRTDLLLSVVVPPGTRPPGPPTRSTEIVLATKVGSGPQVATEIPFAISPEDPDAVDVVPPPNPRELREDVSVDLTHLFVMLAAITLVVGMVGIANTSLVAVLERVPEIGLRRALGAQRTSIIRQFLAESVLVGAVGGLIGSLLGMMLVVGLAVSRQWTPALPQLVILCACPGGALVGAVAGYLPARRAGRTDPATALRR